MKYQPSAERYDKMQYKYCGNSGLLLPRISLGLWHNFGSVDDFGVATDMIKYAFDNGVTPVEETMQALIDIVKQGKALYVGISKYPPAQAKIAYEMLRAAGVPCLISQYRYSMFDRTVEEKSLPLAAEQGSGFIAFSPLAQGLLTKKYLHGIPEHSRAARSTGFLKVDQVTEDKVGKARRLDEIAARRGQTLAEMALAWVLKDERMTSVIVGASSVKQLADNLHALDNLAFTDAELTEIEGILRL